MLEIKYYKSKIVSFKKKKMWWQIQNWSLNREMDRVNFTSNGEDIWLDNSKSKKQIKFQTNGWGENITTLEK